MGVMDVRKFFINKGLKDLVFEMEESTATVELAAKAIGIQSKRPPLK